MSENWKPQRTVQLVAGTPPGGGLDRVARALAAARADGGSLSEEFVLADLQQARAAFEEVTGRRAPDDVLAHIFERFCIGK